MFQRHDSKYALIGRALLKADRTLPKPASLLRTAPEQRAAKALRSVARNLIRSGGKPGAPPRDAVFAGVRCNPGDEGLCTSGPI